MTNGHRGTAHSREDTIGEPPPLDARKAFLRAEAKRRREQAARQAQGAGAALCAQVLGAVELPGACPVSAYWPMASEIDTRPLIEALHARGHAIGLPVILGKGRPLEFRAWEPGLALEPGGFGTRVPGSERPNVLPRLVVVPLLAFDRAGYRLGYGGGFYDRTLTGLRAAGPVVAIGVAFAAQEVPAVPRDAHDQRLDWIVTEAEAIRIG